MQAGRQAHTMLDFRSTTLEWCCDTFALFHVLLNSFFYLLAGMVVELWKSYTHYSTNIVFVININ